MMYSISHLMRYRFDRRTGMGPQLLRLRPAPHCRIPVRAYALEAHPPGHSISWSMDAFGNHQARLAIDEPVDGFEINVRLQLAMAEFNSSIAPAMPAANRRSFRYGRRLRSGLAPYLRVTESGPLLLQWLGRKPVRTGEPAEFLSKLCRRVCNSVEYRARAEPGVQSCDNTLRLGHGSCRDSAWLLTQVLRHLGFASRFVSGYLLQAESPHAAERVELHAWTEVYLPGSGWAGLDSTSGLYAGAGHIPLACAPEPSAAAPVSGRIGKCSVTLEFHTDVARKTR